MRRWFWAFLSLIGIALITVVIVPRLVGGVGRVGAQDEPALEIDMVQSTDGTWCSDSIEDTNTVNVGDNYQVAVCVSNVETVPASFQFDVLYNDELNTCVVSSAPCTAGDCLDNNPDANAGTSTSSTPSFGDDPSSVDCNVGGSAPASCDTNATVGAGDAFLKCINSGATNRTLPYGDGVSAPIAVITFQAAAVGTDTLSFSTTSKVVDPGFDNIVWCAPGDDAVGACLSSEDIKEPPPPEPTATFTATWTPAPTATDTPTPVPGVRMEKDCDPNTDGVQSNCNLWLMKSCVDAAAGKGCLEIDEWIFGIVDLDNPNDSDDIPEGLGAWENQIRFDHKFISLTKVPDLTWLLSGGRLPGNDGEQGYVAGCYISIMSEDNILEGCVTKDDPEVDGQQPGPQGDGLIERITVIPNINDLIYRSDFRPTKDNGIMIDLVDDNCEVTDTQGEQIEGTLPGQLTTVCGDAHITLRFLEGDLNLDCAVTVLDDQAIAFRYGSHLGLQLYDRWFDLEPKWSDDDIDIKDMQFVFGRNFSTCADPIPDDQAIPIPPIDP
jgi:hypothetical protein